ncbi:MAG: dihydrolipoyllysine-residue succinyltransferase [Bacteroidales bacterium]|nr:dihydrolipoyllysine-residue succinyltransferase [Bacteroidales bacterium]
MKIEIKVPATGESVNEVQIAEWLVKDGELVSKDDEIAIIDSDKAALTITAEQNGQLHILIEAGSTVKAGDIIAYIDMESNANKSYNKIKISPLAEKIAVDKNIDITKISKELKGKKITKNIIIDYLNSQSSSRTQELTSDFNLSSFSESRQIERRKMSPLRLKLSQRLVSVKNETAMLTTFNEVNMEAVIEIRKKYKEHFNKKYGIAAGFTSFFAKAATIALTEFPIVNAMIDNDDIVYNRFVDLCFAISTEKGLLAPVIRNAEKMLLTEIDIHINELANKARQNRIGYDDLEGGTFTVTNGGLFGSMLSTPILNPPQSAILGMHNIVERPVAIERKVMIKPVMYIALSYDHRLIDGKDSVSFLKRIKELIENPSDLLQPEELHRN